MVPSSALVPTIRGTACCFPAAKSLAGSSVRTQPSMTGPNFRVPARGLFISVEACSSSSTLLSRMAAATSGAPSAPQKAVAKLSPVVSAVSKSRMEPEGKTQGGVGPTLRDGPLEEILGKGADH